LLTKKIPSARHFSGGERKRLGKGSSCPGGVEGLGRGTGKVYAGGSKRSYEKKVVYKKKEWTASPTEQGV